MDINIKNYIENTFSDNVIGYFNKAFELFNQFEYPDFEDPYMNMLMVYDQVSVEDLQDFFVTTIHSQLDEVLKEHLIECTKETELGQKVEIINFLYLIQDLADYKLVETLLYCSEDDHEILAEIISNYSSINKPTAMTIFETINPEFILRLRQYVHEKVSSGTIGKYSGAAKNVIIALRLYKKMTNRETVGTLLLERGIQPNQDIESYLPFVKHLLDNLGIEDFAYNYISVLLLNSNNTNSLFNIYTNYLPLFITDNTLAETTKPMILKIISQFNDVVKEHNDQA